MSNLLMVPILLDALYLEKDRFVVEPMADFSRQPYTDGNHDEVILHRAMSALPSRISPAPLTLLLIRPVEW